jgi:hypothetical protein
MLKQRKWRLKQMENNSNENVKNNASPIIHYQSKPGQKVEDVVRDMRGKGDISQEGDVTLFPGIGSFLACVKSGMDMISQDPQCTEKEKAFAEYIHRRTCEIDKTKGHEEKFAFQTASVLVGEYESISNSLKTHLFKVCLGHQIDAYMKEIQFFCCDEAMDMACCFQGIKALLLFLFCRFQGRINTVIPFFGYDYDFAWIEDYQAFYMSYRDRHDMPKIFSPIDKSAIPNWSKLNEDAIKHVTHNHLCPVANLHQNCSRNRKPLHSSGWTSMDLKILR